MEAKALDAVEVAMAGTSFQKLLVESAGGSNAAMDAAQATEKAGADMQRVRELLSQEGVRIAKLKKEDLNALVRGALTAAPGCFTTAEYKALLETLTKYAALKARHNTGRRWGLGLGLSAAGAMALTAAVFTSAGLLLVAAPAGAAIGAVAVAADSSKMRRRDRRTAQGSNDTTDAAAPDTTTAADAALPEIEAVAAAAAAPAGPVADETPAEPAKKAAVEAAVVGAVLAAPAAVAVSAPAVPAPSAPDHAASSGNSSPRGSSSDELVSAVVEVMGPAEADAAGDKAAAMDAPVKRAAALPTIDTAAEADDDRDVPAPVQCDSPFAAASRDTASGRPSFVDLPPLGPLALKTSASGSLVSQGSGFATANSGSLPPKPLKKSKSLKKTMKSLKKAFSLKDKAKDTHSKDTGDSDSPLAPPVPPRRSGSFFRRSSSDVGDDSVEGVEASKGSATIKRMVEGIRRSFSLERPSLDMVRPKKARKEEVY